MRIEMPDAESFTLACRLPGAMCCRALALDLAGWLRHLAGCGAGRHDLSGLVVGAG